MADVDVIFLADLAQRLRLDVFCLCIVVLVARAMNSSLLMKFELDDVDMLTLFASLSRSAQGTLDNRSNALLYIGKVDQTLRPAC